MSFSESLKLRMVVSVKILKIIEWIMLHNNAHIYGHMYIAGYWGEDEGVCREAKRQHDNGGHYIGPYGERGVVPVPRQTHGVPGHAAVCHRGGQTHDAIGYQRGSGHVHVRGKTLYRISRDKRMAFLDMLLCATEEGRHMTPSDIREEVDTFMFEVRHYIGSNRERGVETNAWRSWTCCCVPQRRADTWRHRISGKKSTRSCSR